MAERGRTRAFADLLVERQTGQQDSDPYTPVTVEHILETVNSQRALVLYFSMAAGYLYSWLLAPGTGTFRFLYTLILWPEFSHSQAGSIRDGARRWNRGLH